MLREAVIAAATIAAATAAIAREYPEVGQVGFIKRPGPACRHRETLTKLGTLLHDKQATQRYLYRNVGSGECVILQRGHKIVTIDQELDGDALRIRPWGNPDFYWTPKSAVRKPQRPAKQKHLRMRAK